MPGDTDKAAAAYARAKAVIDAQDEAEYQSRIKAEMVNEEQREELSKRAASYASVSAALNGSPYSSR